MIEGERDFLTTVDRLVYNRTSPLSYYSNEWSTTCGKLDALSSQAVKENAIVVSDLLELSRANCLDAVKCVASAPFSTSNDPDDIFDDPGRSCKEYLNLWGHNWVTLLRQWWASGQSSCEASLESPACVLLVSNRIQVIGNIRIFIKILLSSFSYFCLDRRDTERCGTEFAAIATGMSMRLSTYNHL